MPIPQNGSPFCKTLLCKVYNRHSFSQIVLMISRISIKTLSTKSSYSSNTDELFNQRHLRFVHIIENSCSDFFYFGSIMRHSSHLYSSREKLRDPQCLHLDLSVSQCGFVAWCYGQL